MTRTQRLAKERIERRSSDEFRKPVEGDPFGQPVKPKEEFQLLEGVGKKRAEGLAERFDGLKDLSRASTAPISKVEGIGEERAQVLSLEAIKRDFSPKDQGVRGSKRRRAESFAKTATVEFGVSGPDDETVTPAELRQARRTQRDRSAEAKRVDNNRDAPVTGDVDDWRADPSQLDFPQVDTPPESDPLADRDMKVNPTSALESFTEKVGDEVQQLDQDTVQFAQREFDFRL